MKAQSSSSSSPVTISPQSAAETVTSQVTLDPADLDLDPSDLDSRSTFHAGTEGQHIPMHAAPGGRAFVGGSLDIAAPALDPISQSVLSAQRAQSVDRAPTMHPHAKLIHDFYTAFANKDGKAMAAMYHPDASFSDPVFPELNGKEAGAMWQMLCKASDDLDVKFSNIRVEGDTVKAHWDATYTLSLTGRKVLNQIDATFQIKDGKIISHQDRFDFWKWTRMAFPAGLGHAFGWLPPVQWGMQKVAGSQLNDFMNKNNLPH